jgi:hypothetical protein
MSNHDLSSPRLPRREFLYGRHRRLSSSRSSSAGRAPLTNGFRHSRVDRRREGTIVGRCAGALKHQGRFRGSALASVTRWFPQTPLLTESLYLGIIRGYQRLFPFGRS